MNEELRYLSVGPLLPKDWVKRPIPIDLQLLLLLKYEKLFIKKTKNYFNIGYLLKQLSIAIVKKEINFPDFFSISLKLGNFIFLYKKKLNKGIYFIIT